VCFRNASIFWATYVEGFQLLLKFPLLFADDGDEFLVDDFDSFRFSTDAATDQVLLQTEQLT